MSDAAAHRPRRDRPGQCARDRRRGLTAEHLARRDTVLSNPELIGCRRYVRCPGAQRSRAGSSSPRGRSRSARRSGIPRGPSPISTRRGPAWPGIPRSRGRPDNGVRVTGVTEDVLAAMVETEAPRGVLAVCRPVDLPLAAALEQGSGCALPAAAAPARSSSSSSPVRDPGNAGTVIRCADAAGADAVVVSPTPASTSTTQGGPVDGRVALPPPVVVGGALRRRPRRAARRRLPGARRGRLGPHHAR